MARVVAVPAEADVIREVAQRLSTASRYALSPQT